MTNVSNVPGERGAPLHFAGRTSELAWLREALVALCESGDARGGLRLVTGVPGVGKTELAVEFLRRVDGEEVAGRLVGTMHVSPESLVNRIDLFKAMANGLRDSAAGDKVAQHDDRVTSWMGGLLGARAAIERDTARHTLDLPGLLRESAQAGMWDGKALVLAIDELQSIEADAMPALRVLHAGLHGCPILLVGFGLQHTANVLAEPRGGVAGISRLAAPRPLSSLSMDEAAEAVAESLAVLHPGQAASASVERLAAASHGFPQHIHGYLEGASQALRRHGHLDGAALEEAIAHGDERRAAYYTQRLAVGRSRRPMLALVGEMLSAGTRSLGMGDAEAVLRKAGFGVDELEAAIRHGVLTLRDEDESVSFGIPSFHDHMVAVYEREDEKRKTRT